MRIGITCNIQGASSPVYGSDDAEEEFDKPETVESIAVVLRELGHEVEVLGDGPVMLRRLLDEPPQFVFNFAEGTGVSRSREARVPAVLEMLGIPYSGSDPLALAVTLDKDCCKRIVQSAGVRTPRWELLGKEGSGFGVQGSEAGGQRAEVRSHSSEVRAQKSEVGGQVERAALQFPLVLKPAYEGSSKGIRSKCLVESPAELEVVLDELLSMYRQPVLVEEFIAGDEVTVGVVGNDEATVLGAMRIMPTERDERFMYSLEVKRDWRRRVRYETPAQLDREVLARVERAALAAYRVLGCRDVSRLDFRVRDGYPFLLEVNPLPGLNPETGDIVLLAQGYGVSHQALVQMIFGAACQRYGLESRTKSRHPSSVSPQG